MFEYDEWKEGRTCRRTQPLPIDDDSACHLISRISLGIVRLNSKRSDVAELSLAERGSLNCSAAPVERMPPC